MQNIVSFLGLFCIRDLSFGRAAARRTALQLPRAMRVGPNEAPTRFGPQIPGFMRFLDSNSGVYAIFRLKFRGFIQFLNSNFGGLSEIYLRYYIIGDVISDKPLKFESPNRMNLEFG